MQNPNQPTMAPAMEADQGPQQRNNASRILAMSEWMDIYNPSFVFPKPSCPQEEEEEETNITNRQDISI